MARSVTIRRETYPLKKPFRTSRDTIRAVEVIRLEIKDGNAVAQAECRPYARYNESADSVAGLLEKIAPKLEQGMDRDMIQKVLPAGAARNAIDCALWDLEAQLQETSVARLTGLERPRVFVTHQTIVLDTPENMATDATRFPKGTPLKVKLDKSQPLERLNAIRDAASDAPLIVDANESWDLALLDSIMLELKVLGVRLIEQPLPKGEDYGLQGIKHLVPVCADESCHTTQDLALIMGLYDAVNIKLDKTGGLTEAIKLAKQAREDGFSIMLGCMVSTSLAIAPIMHLWSHADYIDLDGPLMLVQDRDGGMKFIDGTPNVAFDFPWGGN